MVPKRIAISGASGLIGSALIERLQNKESVDILCLRRPETSSDKTSSPRTSSSPIRSIDWLPSSGLRRLEQMENVDWVIHLAGRSINSARWTEKEKNKLRQSRVEATHKLASQIAELDQKPRAFLCASAVGFYGDRGDDLVSELDSAGHDFLSQLASDWEAACSPLSSRGVRVIHVRLGVVLSKSGGALTKMLPIFKLGLGGRLGSGRQYWSWICLEDCCRAIEFLLDNPQASGSYNVVSPESVTNRQFTSVLAQVLKRPALLPAPAFALRLALGEMADGLLLSSCRAQPERLLELGFEFQHPKLLSCLQSLLG
jgi:uncharacterized protein (TIGR01777 family)